MADFEDDWGPVAAALRLLYPKSPIEVYAPEKSAELMEIADTPGRYIVQRVFGSVEDLGTHSEQELENTLGVPEQQQTKQDLWHRLLTQLQDVAAPRVPEDIGRTLVYKPVLAEPNSPIRFTWERFLTPAEIDLVIQAAIDGIYEALAEPDGAGYIGVAEGENLAERLESISQKDLEQDGSIEDIELALPFKADLVGGKVPEEQLPSYVDDVLEFDEFADFPQPGEPGKIYIDKSTNYTYRWGGTVYVQIGGKAGGATGGNGDEIFWENDQVVTTSYPITAGKNAMSAGPIQIAPGVIVTVPPGSTWSIV